MASHSSILRDTTEHSHMHTHIYTYMCLYIWTIVRGVVKSQKRLSNKNFHIYVYITLTNFYIDIENLWASQVVLVVKNLPTNEKDLRHRFDTWVGKILWRRKWPCTPVFLPGESHGQRSLPGYSPKGCKELYTTEVT